jgi:hypothetical protein
VTGTQGIRGIRRAVSRREHADELRLSAMHDLREWCRVAKAEGVSAAQIAREAEVSRHGLRNLPIERPDGSHGWRRGSGI